MFYDFLFAFSCQIDHAVNFVNVFVNVVSLSLSLLKVKHVNFFVIND